MFFLVVVAFLTIVWLMKYRRDRAWLSDISRRAVFVTGCDSGFGRETALSLDALGVPVFAGCYSQDGARSLGAAASPRLHTLHLDVTKEESLKKAYTYVMENLPQDGTVLWGIINNAGLTDTYGPLDMTTVNNFRRTFDVNVFGMVSVTLAFLPALKKSRGRIINMSSISGLFPCGYLHSYASSKFAVTGFTDCTRLELSRWGIKVCAVFPGRFDTGFQNIYKDHLETVWNRHPELHGDYGPEYLEAERKHIKKIYSGFCKDLSPVLASYQDALFSRQPKAHYLVGRDSIILNIVFYYTPTWLSDWLFSKTPGINHPLPQILKQ